ncbi:uncharacterized protein B0I36DRAFT_333735 [Microdochium trichocladiopsis]|uniref:Uncharacterized protein n=1 Tax=Microdochium trichocladiopsis TaxID=1682393 RepID=A0A9P9BKC5_9PEZI|nr:uncharacterized protein B0I36DRAFT_333735 [Microdochium trichocladiopsis]KAH7021074.1 hypothetical protein B0I36DRAFT_333735 [Microdochium trichocladiopsis]
MPASHVCHNADLKSAWPARPFHVLPAQGRYKASMSTSLTVDAIWRPMTLEDVPLVVAIADAVHPDLPEDAAVFAERIRLFPAGCHILVPQKSREQRQASDNKSQATTAGLGYIISHPIPKNCPPSLNTLLGTLPLLPTANDNNAEQQQQQQQYYVHDLALVAAARGRGFAAKGIAGVLHGPDAPALQYPMTSLVSVYGTAPFWRRLGFEEQDLRAQSRDTDHVPALVAKLRDYGKDAVYMVRQNS